MDSLLALLRKDRKLSRAYVARKIGVDDTTVYSWETGRRRPSGDNVIELAKLYGVDLATISAVLGPAPKRKRSGAGDGE